jgi:hypothetical protein
VKKLLLSLLLLVSLAGGAQIKPKNYSIGIDYGNSKSGLFDNQARKDRQIGIQVEYTLNRMFSVEFYTNTDVNGYYQYSYAYGYGAAGILNTRFDHFYTTNYVGGRLYFEENYHSTAISLRNKKNYGWYLSYGYRFDHYRRNEYLMTTASEPVLDQNGDYILNSDGSILTSIVVDRFDTFGYDIYMGGVNFGVGWKQFHSKWMYSDMGFYSSAFFRDNIKVKGYYHQHMERRIIPEPFWNSALEAIEGAAKNGKGFEARIIIGFNLDIRR